VRRARAPGEGEDSSVFPNALCARIAPRAWRVVSNDCTATLGQADVAASDCAATNFQELDSHHAQFGNAALAVWLVMAWV
ncbi:MAG: hypothetical protein ACREP7_12470, partial [Lysobacter sp.]